MAVQARGCAAEPYRPKKALFSASRGAADERGINNADSARTETQDPGACGADPDGLCWPTDAPTWLHRRYGENGPLTAYHAARSKRA
jgi:hypothetical protein